MSLEVGSIMPLASPGLWRMSLPAVFFMDGCQPLPVSSVRCHFLVYSHLSLFPTSCRLSVNELCVSSPFLFFPAMSQGEYVFLFFRQGQGVMDPHWRNGTKVRQGRERPGRQTVCVRHTMPGLQSVSCVLSAKQALHFPLGLAVLAFLQRPGKGQKSKCRQRELYIPSEQWECESICSFCSTFLSFHQAQQHIFCVEAVVPRCLHPWLSYLHCGWIVAHSCVWVLDRQKQSTR